MAAPCADIATEVLNGCQDDAFHLQRIVQSIEREMTAAIMKAAHEASAACVEICTSQLRDVHRQMLHAIEEERQRSRALIDSTAARTGNCVFRMDASDSEEDASHECCMNPPGGFDCADASFEYAESEICQAEHIDALVDDAVGGTSQTQDHPAHSGGNSQGQVTCIEVESQKGRHHTSDLPLSGVDPVSISSPFSRINEQRNTIARRWSPQEADSRNSPATKMLSSLAESRDLVTNVDDYQLSRLSRNGAVAASDTASMLSPSLATDSQVVAACTPLVKAEFNGAVSYYSFQQLEYPPGLHI